MANFNYCPLVWMLSSASSLKKIEKLRFLCNYYEISFEELSKYTTSSMIVKKLRAFRVKLYHGTIIL